MADPLLAHNFHPALDPTARAAGKPYPPLGTLVSAAEALRRGVDLAVYDPTFSADPALFEAALDGHRPTRVALLMDPHAIPQKMCTTGMRAAAVTMVRAAKARGAEVLVAGPDVSDHPEHYADADVVVLGEHDRAFLDWIDGGGVTGVIPRGSPRADLAGLPFPAWERVDMAMYASRWRARHGYWEANVSTARGCPYRCNWCAKPTWGRTYHVRPVENVVAEVEALRSRYQPDRLWFTDDIFAIKPAWLAAYRAAVQPRPLPFRCLTRVDLVKDPTYVRDLAEAGCVEVWVGAESGSDAVLERMDKDASVEEIRRASALLRDHGIRRGFFLQLGYPGETAADVDRTLAMVRELKPEEIGVSVSYPLPGTVFHERTKHRLRASNWAESMENRLLFDADYPQAFYDAAREVLRAEHAMIRFTPELSRRGLRRAAGVAWHVARWPVERGKMRWFGR
jgi:anaerobic magnesium-protoporphyrin IX monomethyl ester cyclase